MGRTSRMVLPWGSLRVRSVAHWGTTNSWLSGVPMLTESTVVAVSVNTNRAPGGSASAQLTVVSLVTVSSSTVLNVLSVATRRW